MMKTNRRELLQGGAGLIAGIIGAIFARGSRDRAVDPEPVAAPELVEEPGPKRRLSKPFEEQLRAQPIFAPREEAAHRFNEAIENMATSEWNRRRVRVDNGNPGVGDWLFIDNQWWHVTRLHADGRVDIERQWCGSDVTNGGTPQWSWTAIENMTWNTTSAPSVSFRVAEGPLEAIEAVYESGVQAARRA